MDHSAGSFEHNLINQPLPEAAIDEAAHPWQSASKGKIDQETLQERNQGLALLTRASLVLNSTLDLTQVMDRFLGEVRQYLGVSGSFWLIDPENDELVCEQASGPFGQEVIGWRLRIGEGLVGWVAQHGESLLINDALQDDRHYKGVDQKTGLEPRSMLTVPLITKGKVIGVLQVLDTRAGLFTHVDQNLLESLGRIAAIAIENAYLFKEVQRLAITDHLTGLYNRRGFFTLAEQQIKFAQRNRKELSLLYLDIDDMKRINDRYGHQVGDQVLVFTADLLRHTFRASDIKARIGGDEFVVLALETNSVGVEAAIGRLEKKFYLQVREHNRILHPTISIGSVQFDPQNIGSVDEILVQADKRMYRRKLVKMVSPPR